MIHIIKKKKMRRTSNTKKVNQQKGALIFLSKVMASNSQFTPAHWEGKTFSVQFTNLFIN
jgi:hypothetical protein